MAKVDTERLGQVLANLLSNASKFTPVEGTVEVTLSIHDTGRGRQAARGGVRLGHRHPAG